MRRAVDVYSFNAYNTGMEDLMSGIRNRTHLACWVAVCGALLAGGATDAEAMQRMDLAAPAGMAARERPDVKMRFVVVGAKGFVDVLDL